MKISASSLLFLFFLLMMTSIIEGKIMYGIPDGTCHFFQNNELGETNRKNWPLATCVTCEAPVIHTLSEMTQVKAKATWSEVPNIIAYEYEVGGPGFLPNTGQALQSGTVVDTSVLLTGLTGNTNYEIVIRAICLADTSAYAAPVRFMTSPTCGSTFFDNGGLGQGYPAHFSVSQTICPSEPGEFVSLEFQSVDIAECCDVLSIYDHPNLSDPLLASSEDGNLDVVTATNAYGCLYVELVSGDSTGAGWEAAVSCVSCAPPGSFEVRIIPEFQVTWTPVAGVYKYMIEIGDHGFTPGTGEAIEVVESFQFAYSGSLPMADGGTDYDIYMRTVCQNGDTSAFVGPYYVLTPSQCGDFFYDPAGPNGSYAPGLYEYPLCPDNYNPDDQVQLEFTKIDVDPCCATLQVEVTNGELVDIPLDGSLPEIIHSKRSTGCLRVIFNVFDDQTLGEGWESVVHCNCPSLSRVTIFRVNSREVSFSWSRSEARKKDLEWVIMPSGMPLGSVVPASTGEVPGDSGSYLETVGGLQPDTDYDLYLRTICPQEFGPYTSAAAFRTAPACNEIFYDSGGPDDDYSVTIGGYAYDICPEQEWQAVELVFSAFSTNPGIDFINIYDGHFIDFNLVGSFSGDEIPGTFIAEHHSGCFTVDFDLQGDQPFPGWEIAVNCLDCPPVFTLEGAVPLPSGATKFIWKPTTRAVAYDWEIGMPGFAPNAGEHLLLGTSLGSDSEMEVAGLGENLYHEIYFRADCDSLGISNWSGPFKFLSNSTCGATIYDPGGPNGTYANNENVIFTLCPDHPSDYLTVDFTIFNTQTNSDILDVFEGELVSGFDFIRLSGGSLPSPITTSEPGTCLSFRFISDEAETGLGWEALVSCGPLDATSEQAVAQTLEVFPNPTSSSFMAVFNYPSSEDLQLEIADLTGSIVFAQSFQTTVGKNLIDLDLSEFPSGIYLISINGTMGRAARRIVKK